MPVLITSCHVSLKPKSGPVAAQTTTMPKATANVAGRPDARDVDLVSFVNQLVDLVGRMWDS